MSSAIFCDALTRDYGDVRALDALTLAVPTGSIFAFLGPNGAGKTTTIHLLLGIIEPTSGSARVVGLDTRTQGQAIRGHCGALLEHSGLYERLSAENNLRFHADIAQMNRQEADQRIAQLLTRFGLYERRSDSAGTLSRGMKQKLAIARVLLHRPRIVFFDEPTAGLDPEATVALRRDIVSLTAEEGTTVFLTTHNLTDVEKMATHVAVIRAGRLLDFGTPAELRERAVRTHVTIRMQDREPMDVELRDGESVAPIVTRLVHEGARIEEVRRAEPSLEDVFLHIVNRGGQAISPVLDEGAQAGLPVLQRAPLAGTTAIVKKEWREMMGMSSRASMAAGIALLAIVAALSAIGGDRLIHSPAILAAPMVGFVILLGSISDTFAGERERHTLETLLASALPDQALLLGKLIAALIYGWGASLALLVVVLIGANITHPGVMYPTYTILGALMLTPLTLLFFATGGTLVSLHSATVRDAQTRISALLLALFIPFVAIRPFLPLSWRQQAESMLLTESGLFQAVIAQSLAFFVVDLVLIALAVARFRRSRLLL